MTRLLLLIVGAILLLASNGQMIAPFAAIACMPVLLLWADHERPALGLSVLAMIFAAAHCVMWWGIIPAPGALYFVVAASYGLCHWIPYAAHRLLVGQTPAFAATLVFPAAYVLVEAALDLATPYGSWSSISYAQSPDSGFAQLAALGGLPLATFALAWTGALAAWAWRVRDSAWPPGVVSTGMALALTLISLAPELRTRLLAPPRAIAPIATISPAPDLRAALDQASRIDGAESEAAMAAATALNTDLLQRSARAAQNGARVVVWSETAARLLKRDEAEFLEQATALARFHDLYLFAAYGAFDPAAARPLENRLAAITPANGVAWVYNKAHPIVGGEAGLVGAGVAQLPVIDTPFGRIGAIICHDADFPSFVRQAAAQNVDLLVNPADDWPAIQRLHANMASYRAVENGLTLTRAANGVSQIVSPLGESLASRNSFAGDGLDMIALAPIRRAEVFFHGAAIAIALSALTLAAVMIWRIVRALRRRLP